MKKTNEQKYNVLDFKEGVNVNVLNVRKAMYNGISIVKWNDSTGGTNQVGLGGDCAVKTETVAVVGRIIKVNDDYMTIENREIGTVQIKYNNITGIFPCHFGK